MRRILWTLGLGIMLTAASTVPAHADPTGNQLSLHRNELATEYRKVTKQLEEVDESIEESTDTTSITGNASTVWAVRNTQKDYLQKLQNRRDDLKQRVSEILRDYKSLTRKAEDHYGDLPMWWNERLD
jgi:vacuolar-type H+-ATPase subunit D/Vma8